MKNPGVYSLFASAITAALTAQAQTSIDDLAGMKSATLVAEMLGGGSGTSIDLVAQTTFDGGETWLDVARFTFANTAGKKYATLNASNAKGVTAYAALGSEGVNDGMLGDALRAVVTSVGAYVNTTASLRVHAK